MSDCCPNSSDCCCDMRGLLSFSILWLLLKREMYGQELAEELGRMRGNKPSPGTLYPALAELESGGLVEVTRRGRMKVYRLTGEGRRGAMEACRYFCSAYGEIFREFEAQKNDIEAPN
jgi:PadR family transcriptional regulator, regulatory protein PadR